KKNLDKVFFTLDPNSAKIYAGRARHSFGKGTAIVYQVVPDEPVEWLNTTKGTTVVMAPSATITKVVYEEQVSTEEKIGKKGGVTYFQMGSSLPDNLYNRDLKTCKSTRKPGIAGLNKP